LAGIAAALTHAGTPAGVLTALLLLLPTIAFASAPYNSLAARRGTPPPAEAEPTTDDVEHAATSRTGG
jgi:hypothetical protein